MTAADRRRRIVLAGHQGDEATARAGLTDRDPAVRSAALGALERAGGLDRTTLAGALGDADPGVRRRAAQLAAHHPDVSLLSVLNDSDASVVETAAFAAGEQERPDSPVVTRLSSLATDHHDPLVREAAVAALGAIGAPAGLPAVLHGVTDVATIRRRAVIALTAFDGPEVDDALRQARHDRDWQVRQLAEDLGPQPE